jgi:hypothetical protein
MCTTEIHGLWDPELVFTISSKDRARTSARVVFHGNPEADTVFSGDLRSKVKIGAMKIRKPNVLIGITNEFRDILIGCEVWSGSKRKEMKLRDSRHCQLITRLRD